MDVSNSADHQAITYKDETGEPQEIHCKFIVDASGYGRVLPRLFDLNEASGLKARGSVFAHLEDHNRDDLANNNIFVHSFDDHESWFWVIPFNNNTASIGIVTPNEKVEAYTENDGEKFKAFIKTFPDLKDRFADSELIFEPKHLLGFSVGVKKNVRRRLCFMRK